MIHVFFVFTKYIRYYFSFLFMILLYSFLDTIQKIDSCKVLFMFAFEVIFKVTKSIKSSFDLNNFCFFLVDLTAYIISFFMTEIISNSW